MMKRNIYRPSKLSIIEKIVPKPASFYHHHQFLLSKSHKEGKKSDVISLLSFHSAFDLEIDARRKMEMYFSGIYGPSMHPISSATVWISLIVDIHVYKYIFLRVVSLFHEADSSVSLFQSSNMDFLLHLLLTPAHDYNATFLYSVSCNILHLDPHPS